MKHFIILIILVIALPACHQKKDIQHENVSLAQKEENINGFWAWFTHNKGLFESIEYDKDEDSNLNLLLEQLHKVEGGLSIEISKEVNGIRQLEISAEGDINKFPIVKEIVAKAPAIKGWKVVAFRQPSQSDFTLEYQGIKLTPSKLFFIPIVENDSLDIIIYGKGFGDQDINTLGHYGLIMLDNLLGEYNAVTKVRYYDFRDLKEVEDTTNLRPLLGINIFLEKFNEGKSKNNGI